MAKITFNVPCDGKPKAIVNQLGGGGFKQLDFKNNGACKITLSLSVDGAKVFDHPVDPDDGVSISVPAGGMVERTCDECPSNRCKGWFEVS